MINFIVWCLKQYWKKKFIINDIYWIEVTYAFEKQSWEFFIYNHIDQSNWTFRNYAFENCQQLELFETISKTKWIWFKISYNISTRPVKEIFDAIENMDFKYFQSIDWIWPKTSKRIIIELKSSIKKDDFSSLENDSILYKNIIKSLNSLWYESNKIKAKLNECPIKISPENVSEIIKWLISNIS